MSELSVTLIDVGWGDSILIESTDAQGGRHFGLIDSNDTTYYRSSFIFIKRFFEREGIVLPDEKPVFDFVMLSHAHTDHGQGLKALMRDFGTKQFWYPQSTELSSLTYLLDYSNRSKNVVHHESLCSDKELPKLGDATMRVLWPHDNEISRDENDNSIVLVLELGDVSFVFSGDAEAPVWEEIADQIPSNTRFFKVPHHGSVNGTFGGTEAHPTTPWLSQCPQAAQLGISAHVRPFKHPHQEVLDALAGRDFYRTDEHYHVSFATNGDAAKPVGVKYSRL